MPLTDTAVRNAKKRSKPYKLGDAGGLYLLVKADGARYWRVDYRFNGKRKTLAAGVYPDTSLSDARSKRDEARKLLTVGRDPGHQKKLDRLKAKASALNTFKAVAEEWRAKRVKEGKAEATLTKDKWMLESFAYPAIGSRPVEEIEPPELLAMLRLVEARGHYETARRLRSLCGRIFTYAIAAGVAKRNPAVDLRGALTAPIVRHRAALLRPEQVGGLLRAITAYEGHPVTLAALRLAPLVFVRPAELRMAEWIEFDLQARLWRIPAHKMKMRGEHIVPLSRQAIVIVEELQNLSGKGRYLFPSLRSSQRAMSENTINAALRRLGYSSDEMCGHGFRRTASTLLNEMGFNADWIERQLAHGEQNEIRAAYNAAEYLADRKRMMQEWADYLDQLAAGGQVLEFKAGA